MITAHQAEIIAFIDEGEIIHRDCAVEVYGADTVALAEEGLYNQHDLSALSRYSLDEFQGESNWEYATERVGEFVDRHPGLNDLFPGFDEDRLVDRVYQHRYADIGYPCGHCMKEIS